MYHKMFSIKQTVENWIVLVKKTNKDSEAMLMKFYSN